MANPFSMAPDFSWVDQGNANPVQDAAEAAAVRQRRGVLGRPPFETRLDPAQEIGFQNWKATNAPNDSGADYDLRGAYLADAQRADNGHLTDQFKKPNHPTFSVESQYAAARPDLAGHWDGPQHDQYVSAPMSMSPRGLPIGSRKEGVPLLDANILNALKTILGMR